jgi:hypothetical protein
MGKIWNAITKKSGDTDLTPRPIGQPAQAQTDAPDSGDNMTSIAKGVGILAAVMLVVSIVWVFTFAWRNVHELFERHLMADSLTATLAAGSSVGMMAVLLLVTFGIRHNRMRGLATLYAAGWFAIVVALVTIKTLFDAAASDSPNLKELANNVLSTAPWLANMGSVLAAILAGLCIAPVASMFGAAKHTANDMTEDEARARYAWNAGKLIISGASIGLAVLFGANVIGINVFIAVLLGLVLDVGFIVALQKAESSAQAGDHRAAGTWTKFVWVYGSFIALMAIETIPALAKIMGTPVDVPGITDNQFLHSLGRFAYIAAIGMGILTIVLTATSNIRQKRDEDAADATPASVATIKQPAAPAAPLSRRIAGGIREARAGAGEIGEALRGRPAPQLPEGVQLTATNGRDGAAWEMKRDGQTVASGKEPPLTESKDAGNAALMASGGNPVKRAENGTPYDATGLIVSPDEGEELMRRHREMLERSQSSNPRGWETISEWMPVNSIRVRELGKAGWELVGVGDREMHRTGDMQPSRLHTFRRPKT